MIFSNFSLTSSAKALARARSRLRKDREQLEKELLEQLDEIEKKKPIATP